MSGLTIEPVSERDLSQLAELEALVFPATPGSPDARTRFGEELARSWSRLWVARVGGAPVGYLLFWHVVDEIHLLSVGVHPARRREGIGAALVARLIDFAVAESARLVLLEVRSSNAAAIRLYERARFRVVRTRPAYYSDGEDGLEMELALDRPGAEKPADDAK